jgi:glucokinase
MAEPLKATCHCGNDGCWEVYANQGSVIERVQSRLAVEDSMISKMMAQNKESLSIALIKQAAEAGDSAALGALKDTGTAMGIGLVTLINILNPEMIILGGPLSVVGEYLLPGIEESAARFAFPATKPEFEITISNFGRDSSLIGAASIVVDYILSNPIQIERR